MRLCNCVPAALALILAGTPAPTETLVGRVEARLIAGDTAAAEGLAAAQVAEAPEDAQARFALGAAQFLAAVERLGQGLYRYGLRNRYDDAIGIGYVGITDLPFLRLPIPSNPAPETVTYGGLRALLEGFAEDLAEAEATLAAIPDGEVALPLAIGLVRLDLDGDGTGSEEEALWRIARDAAGFVWLDETTAAELAADFDSADVSWLRGYCHLLMALADFLLAHDWEAAFEATFHGAFPASDLPLAFLARQEAGLREEMSGLGFPEKRPDESWEEYSTRQSEWWSTETEARDRHVELQGRLGVAGIADLIAFAHLLRWPVLEPTRMAAALDHLEAMVALSRESWRRILAETDDAREWIPAPGQSGVLEGVEVSADQLAGWQLFLDEFEALLAGERLLPHWRFERGINLRRMFTEPRAFDAVLIGQGAGVLPYLEDGELTSPEAWRQIQWLLDGRLIWFFVWFN